MTEKTKIVDKAEVVGSSPFPPPKPKETPKPVEEPKSKREPASESPTGKTKQKTMFFLKALQEVINGKKIHKLEWKDKGYYGYLAADERLTLHKPDGRDYQWILSEGDMVGDDYIVLE